MEKNKNFETYDDLRDTIPDGKSSDYTDMPDYDEQLNNIDKLIKNSSYWCNKVVIRNTIEPGVRHFRMKLYNEIVVNFISTALHKINSDKKFYKKNLAKIYQQKAIEYINELKSEEYEYFMGQSFTNNLENILKDGDWKNREGICKICIELNALLHSIYE